MLMKLVLSFCLLAVAVAAADVCQPLPPVSIYFHYTLHHSKFNFECNLILYGMHSLV